jgi:hypothetical protein
MLQFDNGRGAGLSGRLLRAVTLGSSPRARKSSHSLLIANVRSDARVRRVAFSYLLTEVSVPGVAPGGIGEANR